MPEKLTICSCQFECSAYCMCPCHSEKSASDRIDAIHQEVLEAYDAVFDKVSGKNPLSVSLLDTLNMAPLQRVRLETWLERSGYIKKEYGWDYDHLDMSKTNNRKAFNG